MIIDDLITDRSSSDVNILKALIRKGPNMTAEDIAKFLQDSKGAYNYSDLNRVGNAMLFIAEELKKAGEVILLDPKTDWNMSDRMTIVEMNRYLSLVRKLSEVYSFTETPVPTAINTVNDANNIEKVIAEIYDIIQRQITFLLYSGDIFAGEV